MKIHPKWMKGLKAADILHLKESMTGRPTLARFKAARAAQAKHNIFCPECRHIALKLGIEKAGKL